MSKMIRQGDLLFIQLEGSQLKTALEHRSEIKRVTAADPEKKDDVLQLAEGEITGHVHVVEQSDVQLIDDLFGDRVLVADKDIEVKHVDEKGESAEEHDTATLDSGAWIVRQQEEFEPRGNTSRAAFD